MDSLPDMKFLNRVLSGFVMNRILRRSQVVLCAGVIFMHLLSCPAFGQAVPPQTQQASAQQESLRISKIRFKGGKTFNKKQLEARVRTRANRRFLLIPGFNWWLWLYRIGDSGFFGDRIGNAFKATGEPPAYLDKAILAQDVQRLQNFYRQSGYRRAKVEAHIDTTASRRLHVDFIIRQGPPTYVKEVTYDVTSLDSLQADKLIRESLLYRDVEEPATGLSFKPGKQLYSEVRFHEERRRILAFLRNEGFAAVTRDSVRAIISGFPNGQDESSADSASIRFWVRPGVRYRFGDVNFDVGGPEENVTPRTDTLDGEGQVTVSIEGDRKLKNGLLKRSMKFEPGAWYDQSQLIATKRRLEANGVFRFSRIDPLWQDSSAATTLENPLLSHNILLETRERHQMRFEAFMLQRSGVLSTSENELGMGLGATYENVNLGGNGESFRVNATSSVAGEIDSTFFKSAQVELTSAFTLPYLIKPFQGLEDRFDLYDARTQFSLSFLTARREELGFVIRGRGNARMRLEMQHSANVVSYLDLIDISLSNPDTLSGFNAKFLRNILKSIPDPVQRAQIEEDYARPQINNALRYTRRSANVNPLRRDQGYSYEGAIEVGGNLPFLLDRYVYSPDTLEGRIPGISLFRGSDAASSLIYRQYVRLSADFRQYKPINDNAVLAWKFIGGLAQPTGQADLVPFDRRFYSGGASSVRGWRLRGLGPGRAVVDSSQSIIDGDQNFLGGDIKLEASVELRNTILREVLAADWILAVYSDAGNVWFGPRNPGDDAGQFRLSSFYKEIGVGTGFGLRLAWDYLILRLDFAYRVYDPALGGSFFENSFKESRFHFGIGHAF